MPGSPVSSLKLPSPIGRVARYLLAFVIVAAATLMRLAVDPILHDQIPYFIYVAAVVVATWSCGVDGGLLATAVAAFAGNYFFVEPRHQLIPHPADIIAMSLFSVLALGLVLLVNRWKRAENALRERAVRLHQMHEEAERANRLKDEFLATLSHELRTPLNAIVGWSHLLLNGLPEPDRARHAVESIARNAEAQRRLVEDVLDVSRIINGKLRLDVRAISVDDAIRAALDSVQPAAAAREIRLRTDLQPCPPITGDPDRLQQIVWNLLSNAVKFTPRGGEVAVSVEAQPSHVEIRVADTGIGIAPQFLPHLFERFTQQDSSMTRRHGGLGLGLAIVRHLVELHGGTVKAQSAGQDQGAVFVVRLPVRPLQASAAEAGIAAESSAAHPAPPCPRLDGVRVVAVDDDEDARDLIATVLARAGAIVRTATSASEGLSLVRRWKPHALVADIAMPDEDGLTLIRRVRALSADDGGMTPAIALTACGSDQDRTNALTAGYQQHLAKPVQPFELAAAVGRMLASHASGQ